MKYMFNINLHKLFIFCLVLLAVVSVCTAIAAWHWLTDPLTPVVSLTQSLWNHPFFALTSTFLGKLYLIVAVFLELPYFTIK